MKFQALTASLTLIVSGCAITGTSPPTQFYILPTTPAVTQAVVIRETVGLAPISLPPYLDRPQIVTVEEGGRVHLAEFHRWAEPLTAGFSRALAQGLTARLPGKAIVLLPASLPVERTVEIQVQDFRVQQGRCVLTFAWRLRRGDEVLSWRKQTLENPVRGSDYPAIVAAMGQTVDRLAERIASELK